LFRFVTMDPETEFFEKLPPANADARGAAMGLLASLGRTSRSKYPFGNPVSIERRHVPLVSRTPYWLAEKTDGLRVCLVLAQTPASTSAPLVAVLLDRTGKAANVAIAGPDIYFAGSVFDGELVWRPSTRDFALLVFDVAACAGDSGEVGSKPYSVRRAQLDLTFPKTCVVTPDARGSLVSKGFLVGVPMPSLPTLHILSKNAVPLSSAAKLLEALPTLPHASDGFVLTPDLAPAPPPGVAWDVFKVKRVHTLDLLWSGGQLWYGNADQLVALGSLALPDLPTPTFDASEFAHLRSGTVVEVSPETSGGSSSGWKGLKLLFLKPRPDKDEPNNVTCVTLTLKSVLDNVQLKDIAPV
jgi:hypothetical protein